MLKELVKSVQITEFNFFVNFNFSKLNITFLYLFDVGNHYYLSNHGIHLKDNLLQFNFEILT